MKTIGKISIAMLIMCTLAACTAQAQAPVSAAQAQAPALELPQEEDPVEEPVSKINQKPCYFYNMAQRALEEMKLTGKETPREEVLAAYRYVMEHTFYAEFEQPELVDNWRYEDECGVPPTVYEVMAAGPLLYNYGTCEDYSAALIVLLEHMGYEALYVPGLTYSVQNTLVDHAWVMVKLEGAWYHLDPQLEDNVVRGGTTAYRYFLKGDADYKAHHVWGSDLRKPDPHSLTLPACPQSAPQQPPAPVASNAMPDINSLVNRALQNRGANGKTPVDLDPSGFLPPLPRFVEADPSLQARPSCTDG